MHGQQNINCTKLWFLSLVSFYFLFPHENFVSFIFFRLTYLKSRPIMLHDFIALRIFGGGFWWTCSLRPLDCWDGGFESC